MFIFKLDKVLQQGWVNAAEEYSTSLDRKPARVNSEF